MKLLLVALNSQYIHTNLAVRYLKASVKDITNTHILELTVNDNIDYILKNIYEIKPDVIGFSCYIWNIKTVTDIARNIKKILKRVKIILGGPEVSFDPEVYISQGVDFVISGEGEMALREIIHALKNDLTFDDIPSITYSVDGKVISNLNSGYLDPSVIPFPYDEGDIKEINGRIIYYETSRGCPYRCSYCLSSLDRKMRFWDVERVKREVSWLYEHGVRFIKLIDRTFNCDRKRAAGLFKIFSEYDGMRFHMEMVPELIDDSTLEVLKNLDPDMFQFEIGVQSLNNKTLKEIYRKNDFIHITRVMHILNEIGIKTHLDLIAGLPYENYTGIIQGFNMVYNLKPYEVQLGFLKMLKGTSIRQDAGKYGIKYLDMPPYEILSNDCVDYGHLLILKDISFLIDKFYNSRCFEHSLEYLLNILKTLTICILLFIYISKTRGFSNFNIQEMTFTVSFCSFLWRLYLKTMNGLSKS